MKIKITIESESGINPKTFFPSFRDHCEWIMEWLDDDESLEIELEVVEWASQLRLS